MYINRILNLFKEQTEVWYIPCLLVCYVWIIDWQIDMYKKLFINQESIFLNSDLVSTQERVHTQVYTRVPTFQHKDRYVWFNIDTIMLDTIGDNFVYFEGTNIRLKMVPYNKDKIVIQYTVIKKFD